MTWISRATMMPLVGALGCASTAPAPPPSAPADESAPVVVLHSSPHHTPEPEPEPEPKPAQGPEPASEPNTSVDCEERQTGPEGSEAAPECPPPPQAPPDVPDLVGGAARTPSAAAAPRARATGPRMVPHRRPSSSKARPARAHRRSMKCDFPLAADQHDVDEASVLLQVEVDGRGAVTKIRVLDDPGYGFGSAGVDCAEKMTFDPALDDDGKPVASRNKVRIRFRR